MASVCFFYYIAAGPVRNLTLHASTASSLNASWEPPSSFNGMPLPYRLNFSLLNGTVLQILDINVTLPAFANFNSLQPFTMYMITVIARSNGGDSLPSTLSAETSQLGMYHVCFFFLESFFYLLLIVDGNECWDVGLTEWNWCVLVQVLCRRTTKWGLLCRDLPFVCVH